MPKLQPSFIKDFSSGMVTNLNTNLVPRNSVELMMNMDGDEEIGSAVSRLGTGIVNTQLQNNKTILGVHDFRDTSGSDHALIAAVNNSGDTQTVVKTVSNNTVITSGSKWDSLTASTKCRFLTFLDTVLLVNGTSTNAPSQWSGTGSVTTTGGTYDIGNLPIADPDITIEFLDRVYIARTTTDTIYFSGIAGATTVSWTSGNGSLRIEPEDGGGGLTAFSKVPGYILIFKERSMKRWNFSSAFPESLVDIGTPTQECVVKGGGLVAFYSSSNKDNKGFFITNGGRPKSISHDRVRGIKKWVDAIPQSNESTIAGFATDRVFGWSVGDITVEGFDYKNIVLRYNRILDQWSVRSYPSNFTVFSSYVSSNINVLVGGDDDGSVIEIDKADTFDDRSSAISAQVPIFYELKLHAENFGYNQRKELSDKIIVRTRNADGAKIEIYADGKKTDFNASVKSPITNVDLPRRVMAIPIGKQVSGNEFMVSIKGEVDGARAHISEVEFPSVNLLTSY